MSYIATITQAGITAAVNADSNGMTINIGHISVGTSGYTPSREQTQLLSEVDRVAVQSSEQVDSSQWRVMGSFVDSSYTAREVGFHLDDEAQTLFAVFSHQTDPIFYKTEGSTVFQPLTLSLEAVPAQAITINAGGDVSFFYGTEFMTATIAQTELSTVMIESLHRQIQFSQKIDNLEAQHAND